MFLIGFGLGILAREIAAVLGVDSTKVSVPLSAIIFLGTVAPSIALNVRRLHDINKSGWWLFIAFVPFGNIVLLVFYCLPSVNEGNNY